MALNGIDISSYQGTLNQASIAGDFSIIKATEGTGYVNAACDRHYQQAKSIARLRGVYHFAGYGDAIAEANFFIDNVSGYVGDAILVLDWEGSFVGDTGWAKRWLDQVQARTGVKALIYMSEYVVNAYNWSDVINGDYGLWVAKYSDYEIDNNYDMSGAGYEPNVNWGAAGYAMWQWTSRGRLSGYAGDLDCDIFYGDANTWNAYARVPSKQPVIEHRDDVQTQAVPYTSVTVEDNKLAKGATQITVAGVNGVRTITYDVVFTDGVETSRSVKNDSVTQAPVAEVTSVGTFVAPVVDEPVKDNPAPTPTTPVVTNPTQPTTPVWFKILIQVLVAFAKSIFTKK